MEHRPRRARRRVAAVEALEDTNLSRQIGARAVTLDLAQTLHLSEAKLWSIHATAVDVSERLPALWAAFAAGDVDAYRVKTVAFFLREATTDRFTDFLNTRTLTLTYATTHTAAELRTWLRRWRARLEAEQAAAEAERAVEQRRVEISHHSDGTSWLNALLSTPVALAILHRLRQAVKKLPAYDPDPHQSDMCDGEQHETRGHPLGSHTSDQSTRDLRTVDQKQADLIAHWLTSCTGTDTDVRAEIAISIDATDLIGLTNHPGITRDAHHPIPAEWVREMARPRPPCSGGSCSTRPVRSWTPPRSATNPPAH